MTRLENLAIKPKGFWLRAGETLQSAGGAEMPLMEHAIDCEHRLPL
jgi:hypothetical protein